MNLIEQYKYKLSVRRYLKIQTRIAKYKDIEGWLTDSEAYGLYHIASKLNSGSSIVEIGSWKGKSTYCLAMGLKNGKVYAIDPFNAEGEEGSKDIYESKRGNTPLLEQFQNTFKKFDLLEKVVPRQGYSNDYVGQFTVIDFLFIDGDHSIKGCDFDYLNYSPKIKKGGFIAFHDFDSNRDDFGPTWVIKNRVLNNPDFKFYSRHDSLWVAQKIR
jgi:predicted O-methyltransferase YrrM